MKNFLQLLDTELLLTVVDNHSQTTVRLHDHLKFDAGHVVTIDGIDVLPRYCYLALNGVLTISEPFYCWYHRVSGQGWLLTPH